MRPDQTFSARRKRGEGEGCSLVRFAEMIERWKQQLIYWHDVYLDDIDRGHLAWVFLRFLSLCARTHSLSCLLSRSAFGFSAFTAVAAASCSLYYFVTRNALLRPCPIPFSLFADCSEEWSPRSEINVMEKCSAEKQREMTGEKSDSWCSS